MFGRVVVANAHLPDNFMSRQVYCTEFSYKIGNRLASYGYGD